MQSDGQREPVSYGLIISGFVPALAAAAFCVYFIREFRELFDGFGAPLPLLTRLVVDYYQVVFLLPISVLAVALLDPHRAARGGKCLIVGVIGAILVVLSVVVAMYLPIMQMGATKG